MTHPAAEPQAKHVDAAKRRLCHLAGLSQKTVEAERGILAAAGERRAAVQADLDRLQPRVNTDAAAGDQYMALTAERGRLDTMIGHARRVLGE